MQKFIFLSLSSGCIFVDDMPEKNGDGRSRSSLSLENGGSKDEMGEKIGIRTDGTDELDKMQNVKAEMGWMLKMRWKSGGTEGKGKMGLGVCKMGLGVSPQS